MPRKMNPFVLVASLLNTVFLFSASGTYFFIGSIFQEISEVIFSVPVHFIFYVLGAFSFFPAVLSFLGTFLCNSRSGKIHLRNFTLTLSIIWDFILFIGGFLSMALLGRLWRGAWNFGNVLYWGKFFIVAVVLIIALLVDSNQKTQQEDREFFKKSEPTPRPVIEKINVEVPMESALPHQEAFDSLKNRLQNAHERFLKQEMTTEAYRETKRLLLLDYEMGKKVPTEITAKGSAPQ